MCLRSWKITPYGVTTNGIRLVREVVKLLIQPGHFENPGKLQEFYLPPDPSTCMIIKQLNSDPSMVHSEGLVMTRKPRLPACQQRERLSIPACRPSPVPSLPTGGAPHFPISLLSQAPSLRARFCKTKPICRSINQSQVLEGKGVMADQAPIRRSKTNPIPASDSVCGATAVAGSTGVG